MSKIIIRQTEVTVKDFYTLPDLDTIPAGQIVPIVSNPPLNDPERPLEPQYATALPTDLLAEVDSVDEVNEKYTSISASLESLQSQTDVQNSASQLKIQEVADVESTSAQVLAQAQQIYGQDIWDGSTITKTFTGTGTKNDPFIVDSCARFIGMFNPTNVVDGAYFKVTTNLDFSFAELIITMHEDSVANFTVIGGNNIVSNCNLVINITGNSIKIGQLRFENITLTSAIFNVNTTTVEFVDLDFISLLPSAEGVTLLTPIDIKTKTTSASLKNCISSTNVSVVDDVRYSPLLVNEVQALEVEFYACEVTGENTAKNPIGFAISKNSRGYGNKVTGKVTSTGGNVAYTIASDSNFGTTASVDYTYMTEHNLVKSINLDTVVDFNYTEQKLTAESALNLTVVSTNRQTWLWTSLIVETTSYDCNITYDGDSYPLVRNSKYKFTFIQIKNKNSLIVLREVTKRELQVKAISTSIGTCDYWNGKVDTEFISGDGSVETPYQIATCAQWLLLLSTNFNNDIYVEVVADLHFGKSDYSITVPNNGGSLNIDFKNHRLLVLNGNSAFCTLKSQKNIFIKNLRLVASLVLSTATVLFSAGNQISLTNSKVRVLTNSFAFQLMGSALSAFLTNTIVEIVQDSAYAGVLVAKSGTLQVNNSQINVSYGIDSIKNVQSVFEVTGASGSLFDGVSYVKDSTNPQLLIKGYKQDYVKSVYDASYEAVMGLGSELNSIRSDCRDNLVKGNSANVEFSSEPIKGQVFNVWFETYSDTIKCDIFINSSKCNLVDPTWNTVQNIPHYGFYKMTYLGNNQLLIEN